MHISTSSRGSYQSQVSITPSIGIFQHLTSSPLALDLLFQHLTLPTSSSLYPTLQPKTYVIYIGSVDLKFSPNYLLVNVRDILIFQFLECNYTLTQLILKEPCIPLKNLDTRFSYFNLDSRKNNLIIYFVQYTTPQYFFYY